VHAFLSNFVHPIPCLPSMSSICETVPSSFI
jgi:hypothetical protein